MKKYTVFFLVLSMLAISLQARTKSLKDGDVIYDSSAKGKISMKQFRVPYDQAKNGTASIYMVEKPFDKNIVTITWIRHNIKIEAVLATNGNMPAKNKGLNFIQTGKPINFSFYKSDKPVVIPHEMNINKLQLDAHTKVKWTKLNASEYSFDETVAKAYVTRGAKLLGICIDLFSQKQTGKIMAFEYQLLQATKWKNDVDFGFNLK